MEGKNQDNISSDEEMESYEMEEDIELNDSSSNNKKNKEKKNDKKKKNKLNVQSQFLEYIEAYKIRNEFIQTENENIKNYDFTIDNYSSLDINKFNSDFIKSFNEIKEQSNCEKINKIDQDCLFDLLNDMIIRDYNVLIYGFGSKLKLIYDYTHQFQLEQNNLKDKTIYYILTFNCYNQELSYKIILNNIMKIVFQVMHKSIDSNGYENLSDLPKNKPPNQIIEYIKGFFKRINFENTNDNDIDLDKQNKKVKFLIILNNIDGPNFMNKISQSYLSCLTKDNNYINILATCDNINVFNIWDQKIKENFHFYYLKYNTFKEYDVEMNDFNQFNNNNSLKYGIGLNEIFQSFNNSQKELLTEIAKLQIKEQYDKLAPGELVNYLIDNGIGICNNLNRLEELLNESIEHGIVIKKINNKSNKEIYKLNLDKNIIINISNKIYEENE